MVLQVDPDAVEAVGQAGAHRAARLPVRAEHEVVDEQLGAVPERVRQADVAAAGRAEPVIGFNPDPGQLPALTGQLVVAPAQFLLGREQLEPGLAPLLAGSYLMTGHGWLLRVGRHAPLTGKETRGPLTSSRVREILAPARSDGARPGRGSRSARPPERPAA